MSEYGRGPAVVSLEDARQVNLLCERAASFGPLPRGTTVYRVRAGDWRILPDPVGPGDWPRFFDLKPGGINFLDPKYWVRV